jgi:hypothetical protein
VGGGRSMWVAMIWFRVILGLRGIVRCNSFPVNAAHASSETCSGCCDDGCAVSVVGVNLGVLW